MLFEYPPDAPDGGQIDLIVIMEIAGGLIQRHRVYWGWRGIQLIEEDACQQ